jgi:hypothetical protein
MNRSSMIALVAMAGANSLALGVNYAVVVGVDYLRPGQNWAPDANNVAAKLGGQAANWNAANITVISGAAGVAVTPANIMAAIAARRAQAAAGDGFLFYYSGHGSFFADPGDLEKVPAAGRARNVCDESLYIGNGAAGRIGDDDLTTAFSTFAAGVNKLAFLDSCFAGGFWNGTDAGDLDRVAGTTLIAAANENSTAPGSSDITNNWNTWMNNNAFNLQAMNAAQLTGMFNAIKPGAVANPQQKMPPGFNMSYDPIYESFPGAPMHGATAEIWTNIPAPGALSLLALSGKLAARRRRVGH